MARINKYDLSLAGEYRVASELLKRGLNATVTFGNAKSADVVAYGRNRRATVIEVKTSQLKTKVVTSFYNKYQCADQEHPDFWVLVQIRRERNGDYAERFFVLAHEELALIQAEHNRSYRIRHGDITSDEEISWERHYELSRSGVDNVLLTEVEPHEDRWDQIVAFCETSPG